MLLDAHVHRHFSSGEAFGSPTEMVLAARRWGLLSIALTDHDTCAGVPEAVAAGERHGVLVIPAAELVAARAGKPRVAGSDAHSVEMVGLGRTWLDCPPALPDVLAAIRAGRTRVARRTFIPIPRFYRWIDDHFPAPAATRLKAIGSAAYAYYAGRNALGILADLARCLGEGDRVPHGLPWRLPQ
jgi:hypothetical protein